MHPGYQLLSEAKDMPEQYQYLRVRLEMEHHRLLDWSQVGGLLDGNEEAQLRGSLRVNRHLLLDVLTTIRTLLENFRRLNGRYEELRPTNHSGDRRQGNLDASKRASLGITAPAPPSKFRDRFPRGTSRVMAKALDLIDHAPQAPQRLRWATFDKSEFEGLLKRLTELNDFLQGLMDDSQSRALQQTQHQTYLEILQLHSSIEDLKQLVRALSTSEASGISRHDVTSVFESNFLLAASQREEKKA